MYDVIIFCIVYNKGGLMPEIEVGFIEHWFGHLMVAGIKMTNSTLKSGDMVHIKGHTSDFTCKVGAIQKDHGPIPEARSGDDIGIKVPEHVREHDKVYKIVP